MIHSTRMIISIAVLAAALLSVPSRASDPALGSEFQVNDYTTGRQLAPAVASTTDGDFVVLWQSFGSPGSSNLSIQSQRFSSDGSPIAGQFAVSDSSSAQYHPAVAANPSGGFIAAWTFWQGGTALTGIRARRFDTDGNALGDAFQVDSSTLYYQQSPEIATRRPTAASSWSGKVISPPALTAP